ncbi:hypothetical protein [Streptomyces sp. NBC_01198]|uniref:hypothetical protein n=1 Tax=Streptomyces sp. NBC_01198 TaxID=2903769 RepID=UPI002E1647C7|nr:hypothetical protein OG702_19830 [Streptomyces sp. NBC_01198]
MSNSAGYSWSYVDVEAERRRELRGQLAQETARTHHLRGQARSLRRAYRTPKVDVHLVSVPASADSAELAAALESARRTNEQAEAELSRIAADVWTVPPGSEADTGAEHAAAPAAQPAAVAAAPDRTAQVRASALVEAEAMLRRDGASCEPDDLPVFARRLAALRQAGSADEARTLLHDLGVLVHKSTQRQRHAVRLAALRARLLDRLEDASPADREHLTAAVKQAPDPSHLEREVQLAVAAADTARHRSTLADTLMQVLSERRYAVGDGFADLLAEQGSVVVPFGEAADAAEASGAGAVPDGYGVRLALARDRPGLTTVLVRAAEAGFDDTAGDEQDGGAADGREAAAEADREVQRWFCDSQLPAIEDAVREQGVDLSRTSALPPGVLPTAVVPDGSWPDAERGHDDGDPADRRRKPRKKAKPARRTGYAQERPRER